MIRLFTSESVTEGHPDKVCDLISDSILDEILTQDPNARVAAETCATTGFVLCMGEVTTSGYVDVESVARRAIADIGYNDSELGFESKSCAVQVAIHSQSPDIAMGVDKSYETRERDTVDIYDETGAGDQGLMFGYACDETSEFMPLAITLAHGLTAKLASVRKSGELSFLRPDGKAQVTVEYDNGVPTRVDTVLISTQHSPSIGQAELRSAIIDNVIKAVIPAKWLDERTKFFVNPTGAFVIGGPMGDSGLTGRKIIVDTYGGSCPHGGGAFSGKDPTKVDRSASYMARYVCKNVVASGLSKKCQLQVGYAIGVARPVSVSVDTFGTGVIGDDVISKIVEANFDFRPRAIIDNLDLRKPIYRLTTNYGHFGKSYLPWERIDKVETLKKCLRDYIAGNESKPCNDKKDCNESKSQKESCDFRISSFEIDHDVLQPGFYLSRVDGDCYTYDCRLTKPNVDTVEVGVLHSIEHMLATTLRSGEFRDTIIYVGPMGCRTGLYLIVRGQRRETALEILIDGIRRALELSLLPGRSAKECGNYREHDFEGAKQLLSGYLELLITK